MWNSPYGTCSTIHSILKAAQSNGKKSPRTPPNHVSIFFGSQEKPLLGSLIMHDLWGCLFTSVMVNGINSENVSSSSDLNQILEARNYNNWFTIYHNFPETGSSCFFFSKWHNMCMWINYIRKIVWKCYIHMCVND
jgi:hypothetical protein